MDIFEFWLKGKRNRVTLPKLTNFNRESQVIVSDLDIMHLNQVNNNFNNYVLNNGINPVALGYAPISR